MKRTIESEKERLTEVLRPHGYVPIEPVGKGGFATCWKVNRFDINEIFVSKEVRLQEGRKEERIKQTFLAELDALVHLTHFNIIQVFNYFSSGSSLYLILEYCPRGSLYDMMSEFDDIPVAQILHYAKQILTALLYMHQNNIAHLDIKPQNILLDKYGRVKIADFGLATVCRNNQLSDHYSGSLAYMAPEILEKQPYNPFSADVWSFGVTLYHIAFGSLPWLASSRADLEQCIKFGYSTLPPNIDPLLGALIKKSIVVKPENRATVTELLTLFSTYDDNFIQPRNSATTSLERVSNGKIIKPQLLSFKTQTSLKKRKPHLRHSESHDILKLVPVLPTFAA